MGWFGEIPRVLGTGWGPVPKVPFEGGSERRLRRKCCRPPLGFLAMILKTARLTLRPQRDDDAVPLYAILSDPEAMRYWSRPAITRLAVVEELIAEQQAAMVTGCYRYWSVVEEGDVIGSVDVSDIRQKSAELGFLFRRSRWGLGLASEAVAAVIAHAMGSLTLQQLVSVVQMGNKPAIRVLEKNRFVLVDRKNVMIASGEVRDCGFYLLRSAETGHLCYAANRGPGQQT